MVTTDKTCFL